MLIFNSDESDLLNCAAQIRKKFDLFEIKNRRYLSQWHSGNGSSESPIQSLRFARILIGDSGFEPVVHSSPTSSILVEYFDRTG